MLAILSTVMQFEPVQQDPFQPFETESDPSLWSQYGMTILLVAAGLVILTFIISAIEIVHEKEVGIVERLGKFHKVMPAGINLRVPIIDQVVDEVLLQIQQLEAKIKVKTKDNVFVTLPIAVQYRVIEGSEQQAYYEIEEPTDFIESLVLNETKSTATEMDLEDVFASRDRLQDNVIQTLGQEMGQYGYEILKVVVDNPELSGDLEASFNDVTAAKRRQDAATMDAEATRIREVGIATAQGEATVIMATKWAEARDITARGNATAIETMIGDTGIPAINALDFLQAVDRNDAIRDASNNGATVVVATENPGQHGLYAPMAPANGNRPAPNEPADHPVDA